MDIIVFLYVISCSFLVSFFYIKIKKVEIIEKNDEKEKELKKILKKSLVILLIFFILAVVFTVLRFKDGDVKDGNIKILSIFSILSFLALLGNVSTIVSEKRKSKGYKFDTDVMKYLKNNLVELRNDMNNKKNLKKEATRKNKK